MILYTIHCIQKLYQAVSCFVKAQGQIVHHVAVYTLPYPPLS